MSSGSSERVDRTREYKDPRGYNPATEAATEREVQRCSSDSQTARDVSSSSPKKKRACSTTTTSELSTSCSGSSTKAREWLRRRSNLSVSCSSPSDSRSKRSSARG